MPSFLTTEEPNRLAILKQMRRMMSQRRSVLPSLQCIDSLKRVDNKEHVILKDRPSSSRPCVTDDKQTRKVLKFRDHSFKIICYGTIEANVSKRTVMRRLTSAGVKVCRPAVKKCLQLSTNSIG